MSATSGMKLLDDIRAGRADAPAGIKTLGLEGTHRLVTRWEPGAVDMLWPVDGAYANLEGATICSWLTALADQALFFASNTLCVEGETTRTLELSLTNLRNVTGGELRLEARILGRGDDRMIGTCTMRDADGELAAVVNVTIGVVTT